MNEDQPGPSEDAPACGTLVALGSCAFVAGLALGLTQPLAFVAIGPGIVAGATYVGLLFLACIVGALVMMALAFFGGRWFTVPAFVACGSLALGLLAGNWTAAIFDIGFGSSRPAAVAPSLGAPAPVSVARSGTGRATDRPEGRDVGDGYQVQPDPRRVGGVAGPIPL